MQPEASFLVHSYSLFSASIQFTYNADDEQKNTSVLFEIFSLQRATRVLCTGARIVEIMNFESEHLFLIVSLIAWENFNRKTLTYPLIIIAANGGGKEKHTFDLYGIVIILV